MSYQRKRGLPVKIWPIHTLTDDRGNEQKVVNLDAPPIRTKGWIFAQRSSRAEVPGQQKINVVRIGIDADLTNVELASGAELYGRVEYMGKLWDVVAPPAYHHGSSRHTRHWSVDIRERP